MDDREYEAFVKPLREGGIAFDPRERLEDAVHAVIERAEAGDVVLLLGAQGMDRGMEIAREWLARNGAP